jgi:hypothetical protein
LSLIAAILLLLAYLLAPVISAKIPALEPVLTLYVNGINKGRVWLDQMMQSSTDAMRGQAPDGT